MKKFMLVVQVFLLLFATVARALMYTVVNTNDSGVGSLRFGIEALISNPPPRIINFAITPTGGVLHTIGLLSPLPDLTNAFTINAATQPGFSNAPLVRLSPAAGGVPNGLRLLGGGRAWCGASS